MAKLVCILDDRILGEYALNQERLSIGRKKTNDIVIDNLTVSGVHAYILTIGEDSFLEDANSTNGSLVNANPVKKHALLDGDVIEIGRHRFTYVKHGIASIAPPAKTKEQFASSTPLAKTPHTQPPSLKSLIQMSRPIRSESEHRDELVKTVKTEPTGARLRILTGANSGQTLALTKSLTTLGQPGVQVAVITKRDSGYFLSPIEGLQANVNDNPIATPSYQLQHHDVLEIAGIKMEFALP